MYALCRMKNEIGKVLRNTVQKVYFCKDVPSVDKCYLDKVKKIDLEKRSILKGLYDEEFNKR